jgi:hypothetical protein
MRQFRNPSATRLIALAAIPLAMALGAGVAGAQYGQPRTVPDQQRYPNQQQRQNRSQQELFEWSGRVDSEIRIQVNRNDASVMQAGRNERTSGRVRSMNALPPQDGTVTVQVLEGRGQVDVIQQPNSRNGYTAVVRVRDPQGGASRYRVAAYWTPNGNFGGRRRGNR